MRDASRRESSGVRSFDKGGGLSYARDMKLVLFLAATSSVLAAPAQPPLVVRVEPSLVRVNVSGPKTATFEPADVALSIDFRNRRQVSASQKNKAGTCDFELGSASETLGLNGMPMITGACEGFTLTKNWALNPGLKSWEACRGAKKGKSFLKQVTLPLVIRLKGRTLERTQAKVAFEITCAATP